MAPVPRHLPHGLRRRRRRTVRRDALDLLTGPQGEGKALLTGTWALALLAVACVAVLVGGRLAGQTRRAGLFKAVGATPGFVAVVLLAEHVIVAPAATVLPAIRGARTSTVRALTEPVRPPRRSPGLIALSARMPVPFLLGVRLAARRPRRAVLATVSLAVTVAMVVAAIAMHGDLARKDARATGVDFVPGAPNPVTEQVGQVVTVLTLALLVLAAVNAVLVAWATSLDAAVALLTALPVRAGCRRPVAEILRSG